MPGRVHVTEAVVRALDGEFRFEERGTTDIKGLGEMRTYFLVGGRSGWPPQCAWRAN